NGYSSEIRINRPGGDVAYYLLIANPYVDENKELIGFFAILVDVNKYKKAANVSDTLQKV
ncbi:MAG: hypothetical protein GXY77_05210, partial [Fibrobacter sp.]|nr:hypothetical protein [Fibrobacter sp.]